MTKFEKFNETQKTWQNLKTWSKLKKLDKIWKIDRNSKNLTKFEKFIKTQKTWQNLKIQQNSKNLTKFEKLIETQRTCRNLKNLTKLKTLDKIWKIDRNSKNLTKFEKFNEKIKKTVKMNEKFNENSLHSTTLKITASNPNFPRDRSEKTDAIQMQIHPEILNNKFNTRETSRTSEIWLWPGVFVFYGNFVWLGLELGQFSFSSRNCTWSCLGF